MRIYIILFAYFFLIFEKLFAESIGLGKIADNITATFESLGRLLIAIAYISGIGFSIAALFKFKQHKDNPTQIPIGTPIALLILSISLIFLPMFFKPAGETLFGNNGMHPIAGGFRGSGIKYIPGGE